MPGRTFSIPSTITCSPAERPEETSHWSPMARLSVSIRCRTLPASSTTSAMGSPFGDAADPLLRNQDGLFGDTLLHDGPNKHAREEQMIRIRDHDTQGEGPGRRVYRDVSELQRSFQGIGCSVFQEYSDFFPVFSIVAELAGSPGCVSTAAIRRTTGSRPHKWDPVAEWLQGRGLDRPSQAPRPSRWTCLCARKWAR